MIENKIKNILIPSISKLDNINKNDKQKVVGDEQTEFDALLKNKIDGGKETNFKLSSHALKRIQERNIDIDGDEFLKLKNAFLKLKAKGGRSSLVITDRGAYILDVAKNTVVTAVDRQNLKENVFTKIDSTLIID